MNRAPHPGRHANRRELLLLATGAFVVASLPLALWRRKRRPLVRRTLPVMGTLAELAVVHDDPARAQAVLDAAFDVLARVDAMMSRFRADSEVGRVNTAAGTACAVPVGPATAHVLERALAWADWTDGAFDPCLGRAVALWDVEHRREPPPAAEVSALAGGALWQSLELRRTPGGANVRLARSQAGVDLGGIAKGFAIDLAVAELRTHGILQACVNVGGDLFALGASEDGDPWRVGVRDPADPTRLVATLDLADAAVATSGDYERGFRWRGRTYHHLLDPVTASPRTTATHSLTVRADDTLSADAAATAGFGRDGRAFAELLARHVPGARVIA